MAPITGGASGIGSRVHAAALGEGACWLRLCPTACPTGARCPMAKPKYRGIIIRVSGVRVPPPALRKVPFAGPFRVRRPFPQPQQPGWQRNWQRAVPRGSGPGSASGRTLDTDPRCSQRESARRAGQSCAARTRGRASAAARKRDDVKPVRRPSDQWSRWRLRWRFGLIGQRLLRRDMEDLEADAARVDGPAPAPDGRCAGRRPTQSPAARSRARAPRLRVAPPPAEPAGRERLLTKTCPLPSVGRSTAPPSTVSGA
jgi:hypothetical protein